MAENSDVRKQQLRESSRRYRERQRALASGASGGSGSNGSGGNSNVYSETSGLASESDFATENVEGFGTVDPTSATQAGRSADAGTDYAKRKPGRKSDSEQEETISLTGWQSLIELAHVGFAALTKTPEFALEPSESAALAKATKNVMRHYKNIPKVSPATADWIWLAVTCRNLYGTRFAAMALNAKIGKAAKASAGAGAQKPPNPSPSPAPEPAGPQGMDPVLAELALMGRH